MAEYRELFEELPDGVTLHNPSDGSILETNKQFCEMLGYTREELLERDFDALHFDEEPYTSEKAREYVRKAAREGTQTFEWVDKTAAGEPLPVEVHLSQTTINGNERILAVVRDITERKEREEALDTLRRRYELVVEATTDALWDWDLDADEITRSGTALTRFGYDYDDFTTDLDWWEERLHPNDRDRVVAAVNAALEGPETEYDETYRFRRKDGTYGHLRSRGNVVYDDDGEPTRMVGAQVDITERVEGKRELQRQKDRLDKFGSLVSHDLRNPLNVITGHVELARDTDDPQHLDRIEAVAKRMETLIDDTLTLARQGETVAETEPVDLGPLATKTWDRIDHGDSSLAIHNELGVVEGDPDRLDQVLANLFTNAVKHANEPAIRIGPLADGFYIKDDGPGIPTEDREQVFDRGYSTSEDGTGFGLAIVKSIVEAHGWSILATEGTDGGARFEVTGIDTFAK